MFWNKGLGIARGATALGLSVALALGGVPALTNVAWADTTPGNVTIGKAEGQQGNVTYEVYQLFKGDVTSSDDGETLSNIDWGSTAARDAFADAAAAYEDAGHTGYDGSTAQDAADYIKANLTGDGDARVAASDSLAELLARELAKEGVTPTTEVAAGATASLADGYYLFVTKGSSLGKGAAGTSPIFTIVGGEDVNITEKVTPPTVTKEVREDSTGEWGRYADANKDQDLSYRLKATLPSNLASFTTYHLGFVDYLSQGLTYVEGSAKVYVVHADKTEEEVTNSFDISYAAGDDGTQAKVYEGQSVLTVDCEDIKAIELKHDLATTDTIEVRYTAHLDGDSVIGSTGNPNQAKLVYSNNPNVSGDGETELVDPVVYTYQLSLHKKDKGAGEDVGLEGARFTLQVQTTDGTSDTASKNLYLQEDGSLASTAHEFVTDKNGNITVQRIDAGTYLLKEVAAPTGYQATADTTIAIKATMPKGEAGSLSLEATASGNDDVEVASAKADTGTVSVTISDVKNVGMPQTGSTGFVALMAGGGSMIVLSLAVMRRRSKSKGVER